MNKRIGIIGENSIGYIETLLNIWNAGDCAVLIDWRIPMKTAIEMLEEASVEICYIEEHIFSKNSFNSNNEIEFRLYNQINDSAEVLPFDIYNKFNENYSKKEAVIIYSSGTTGKSKGIILSHYAININSDAIIDYMKPEESDCIYIVKTLSHSSTLTGELIVALKSRMKLIIAPSIMTPRIVFQNIKKFNVTILCVNPKLLSMYCEEYVLDRYKPLSLKKIYVSGSILNEKEYLKANETLINIEIYNVYGLSEAGPRVAAQRVCRRNNSVGKPIKGVEIIIVNDKGIPVDVNEKGILHVKTSSIFDGYVLGELKFQSLYKNWLNTGDIGYLDEEDELHIVDRIDDVIIIDSHKIYPSEVEKVIMEYESIKDCVVSYDIKSQKLICVYKSYGKDDIRLDALIRHCSKKICSYEMPRIWKKVDLINRTINGKVLRYNNLVNIERNIDHDKL
jgi:Acyl-CoA synthetases (AMP-forming)/AMP-acid ligases II